MRRLAHLANWSQAAHSPAAACFSATSALATWGTWTFRGAAQGNVCKGECHSGSDFVFVFFLNWTMEACTVFARGEKQGSRGTGEGDVGRSWKVT